MKWAPWSRADVMGLARYVTPEAKRCLTLDVSRFDLASQPGAGRRTIIEAIYNALLGRDIHYDLEEYHPSERLQRIRTPAEVLEAPRKGTCLDLATLFCGLCLDNEILPMLIVIEGHALAAVSLRYGLREWDAYRPEREWFEGGPLTDLAKIRGLINHSDWIAVECTGFARSERLGQGLEDPCPESVGRTNGVLPFERALAAGRQQLDCERRPFHFALDIAVAHNAWRIGPPPFPDLFQLLAGAPPQLSPYMRARNFQTIIEERTRDFVGRGFVFEAIDRWLEDSDFRSGYIVIRGEPGIGKTALMGQLVKERGYVHHFNIAPQNIRSPQDFLANVCAQLIVRYRLNHPTLPPEATKNSKFLDQLLGEAAETPGKRPVVVLVDALDEAEDVGLPPDANRLFLPAALPAGVFFAVTTREEHDPRLFVDRSEDIYLRDDDPRNRDDVRQYVRNFLEAHHQAMVPRVTEWRVDEEEFINVITEKSQGNFMYLVFVLRDIRDGRLTKQTVDNVRKLPSGLRDYYKRHWRAMRAHDRGRFEHFYKPVVCMLATVREPVLVAQLEEWTKLSSTDITEVIQDWRQFLNEEPTDGEELRYRVYHASFQDFLREEVGLTRYHNRIAQTALDKIPDFGRAR